MKTIVELQEEPTKGCLLVFDGRQWKPIRAEMLLDKVYVLEEKVAKLEKDTHNLGLRLDLDEGKISEGEYSKWKK